MKSKELLSALSGGQTVVEWFGGVPSFHDAVILKIDLLLGGTSTMQIHVWNLTDRVDSEGFIETEKHAVVVVTFALIQVIELVHFDINNSVFSLEFTGTPAQTEVSWTSSIGVEGRIVAGDVNLVLKPGRP